MTPTVKDVEAYQAKLDAVARLIGGNTKPTSDAIRKARTLMDNWPKDMRMDRIAWESHIHQHQNKMPRKERAGSTKRGVGKAREPQLQP